MPGIKAGYLKKILYEFIFRLDSLS